MDRGVPVDVLFHRISNGIFVPEEEIIRKEEYDPEIFNNTIHNQEQHFWHLARYRFILRAFEDEVRAWPGPSTTLRVIDFGGGCGGWIKYLKQHSRESFGEIALADLSLHALELANRAVGNDVDRYQVDLLHIPWKNRWDVAFLLDVLEHFTDDAAVLREVWDALCPGGLLFVATPALKFFWSANDETAGHCRRYSRKDFQRLAEQTGFNLRSARYFMFFLSPILWLSRMRWPDPAKMTPDEIRAYKKQTHKPPAFPLNQLLRLIFSLETPTGLWIRFPWGTSILGIFQKPRLESGN
jgi:2-polyprenyl-3-methyl-5-hydroxy-6-metoxy-1,4-benzoquinol methylase